MLLFSLLACIRLQEGSYDFDYDPVSEDSCDIYGGGQIAEDTEGALSWDDGTLLFEFDGADDALEFDVDGTTFTREVEDDVYFAGDVGCWLAVEQQDTGEMESNGAFVGHTEWLGVLQGACGVFDAMFDDPCTVAFDWSGQRQE